jgi:2-hydroxy-3-oxopropionate reductase
MTETVGIVGHGVLGSAIVEVLLANGFNVLGHDKFATHRAKLEAKGMTSAASPRAVFEGTHATITCLPTAAALQDVVSGEGGFLESDESDRIVVEMSTLPVLDKERVRDTLAEHDIKTMDCPVSGNRIMALRGELTAFASGDEGAFAAIEPLLRGFCRDAHYVGPFGNGMKMKICGNILNLVHNSVAAEVMVLGMKSGLDPSLIHKVISGSGSSSRMFDVRGALMANNDYYKEGMNFSIPLKDAGIITAHAAENYCPIPVYQAALQPYYAAVAQGHHDADAAAVCAALELAANCVREEK